LEKTFQDILVRFQLIPGVPGREGGRIKAEMLKI